MKELKLKIVSSKGVYELPFQPKQNGITVDPQKKHELGIQIAHEMYGDSFPKNWEDGWENNPFASLLPCFVSPDGIVYICEIGRVNSMAKSILTENFPEIAVDEDTGLEWVLIEGYIYIDPQEPLSFRTKELPTNDQKNVADALFNVTVNNDTATCVMGVPKLKNALSSG